MFPTQNVKTEAGSENKVILRSAPIPKVVNKFMLQNYGSLYYNSHDIYERNLILKQIVEKLKIAGYNNISIMEVERRLKNMKSHYRRKKADLKAGLVSSVEWEYFAALDDIFSTADSLACNEMSSEIQKTVHHQKRKMEQTAKPEKVDEKPKDLSIKRPKVIEFSQKSEITRQINEHQAASQEPPKEDPLQILTMKIIESMKSIDAHRLALDQQRLAMEVRRYELDVIGYQLSELLHKITHPSSTDSTGN